MRLLPKRSAIWLAVIVFLFAVLPEFPLQAAAPDVFTDFDGDGFDDNHPDDDSDGIPDEFEPHRFFGAGPVQLTTSMMFSGQPPVIEAAAPRSVAEKFGSREFSVRGLCEPRYDFENDFSSGIGIGGGGGAGACAGGVCF